MSDLVEVDGVMVEVTELRRRYKAVRAERDVLVRVCRKIRTEGQMPAYVWREFFAVVEPLLGDDDEEST